jgi:hypothetical protein
MRDFPIGIVPGSNGTNERYSLVDSAGPFLVLQQWPCLACRKPILFSRGEHTCNIFKKWQDCG